MFVMLAALGFGLSHTAVTKMEKLRTEGVEHVSLDDRYKLQLFRDQRNWWISLTNLILWIICWRVANIMKRKNAYAFNEEKKTDDQKAAKKKE